MKDTEKEYHYERERAWNMPVSARSRTTSNSSITGFPARPGLEQSRVVPSREHSRPSSPSESVRSRATEDEAEVNHEGERNSASPLPTRSQHQQRQRPASPLPSPSLSRVRTQSSLSKPNNPDTQTATQAQNRLRRNPSQSSLTSEGSSRPSSPAEFAHRLRAGRQDEEVNHERERNWGSRQQKWTHSPANNKRATSPNLTSHSRVRTQSLESDSSVPATSTLGRPPATLLKRQPGEPSSPAHRPAVSSPSPEVVESQKSGTSVPSFLRSKPTNGHTYDKPPRMSSHPIRPDSPLAPSNINGSAEPNGTPLRQAPASHFGWQFPRNRPQLPDFEPNITSPEHSPPPVHQSMVRNASSITQSHIPVRSPGRVPKIDIKPNGDAKKFTKGHKRATTEFAEANGAIPPRIHFQPESEREQDSASEIENLGAQSPLGKPYISSVSS